ncbi:hypothetical protein EX895_003182 [Sporisorium graminicola]|uniref:Major facilitator superfamily (MFS) profile domain-containing protein n=1 Tax=Sporisorium graminicola TaxID=280036 RepID=A0A4U7KV87_9BASI|nr:hypothetical protein EX895_003182 [Sporisorium graminicola]TKY88086.1 hypothetical protein EX895_003182 [Sporisorium graminicola]
MSAPQTADETTRLISQSPRDEPIDNAPAPGSGAQGLDRRAKRNLLSVFVANGLLSFGHYLAIGSIMDLIRGLSCQEYYQSRPPSSPDKTLECSLVDIEARTSSVFSYMLSIGSLFSCLSALALAPWLLKRLGRRGTMLIGVLTPALELMVVASIPNRFSSLSTSATPPMWIESSPTSSLRMLLAEALVFGIVACPDAIVGIVSSAIVLDSVPVDLRSTWLARLASTQFLGMLAATVALRFVNLDTGSDLVSDKLPIRIGAAISLLAPLWTLFTLAKPPPSPLEQLQAAQESTPSVQEQSIGPRLTRAPKPMRLLWPATSLAEPKRDWRLVKLMIAATLCSQITLTTNTVFVYLQSRFGLHARDLSLALGLVGTLKWIFLVAIFPRLARYARSLYTNTALADRLLAILSLLLDVLAWIVVIVGGRVHSLPIFLLAMVVYVSAAGNASLITSLASLMLPQDASVDEMMATLTSMANIMSTIGPILNSSVYSLGLDAGFPELVFGLTALVSVGAAALVASTSIGSKPTLVLSR